MWHVRSVPCGRHVLIIAPGESTISNRERRWNMTARLTFRWSAEVMDRLCLRELQLTQPSSFLKAATCSGVARLTQTNFFQTQTNFFRDKPVYFTVQYLTVSSWFRAVCQQVVLTRRFLLLVTDLLSYSPSASSFTGTLLSDRAHPFRQYYIAMLQWARVHVMVTQICWSRLLVCSRFRSILE